MSIQFILAYLHIITLGLGVYAIWTRANALKKLKDAIGLEEVFAADNLWGLASLLWIITGLFRAFGGFEKGTDYYLHSSAFLWKMGLFLLVFALEIKPMVNLIQWRIKIKKGEPIDFKPAALLMRLSQLELALLALMILLAVAMARGLWF